MISYISTFLGRKEHCVVWIVISGGVMCREIVTVWAAMDPISYYRNPISSGRNLSKKPQRDKCSSFPVS